MFRNKVANFESRGRTWRRRVQPYTRVVMQHIYGALVKRFNFLVKWLLTL